jgi:hypothetical protein
MKRLVTMRAKCGEDAVAVQDESGSATAWTERKKKDRESIDVNKPAKKKKVAKKFRAIRNQK